MSSPTEEALNRAMWHIDGYVLEAPRACSYAVFVLVGDRCWGAALFDQSPLMRVYLASVGRLAALGLHDPGYELKTLLEGCVAKAKQNEHPAFVHSVRDINPVEFLAGLLAAAVDHFVVEKGQEPDRIQETQQ